MKVLVLDDEDSLRTLLCDNLAFEEIETVQASSGKQALQLATTENPDLAVIDIGLPDMTGWDVCKRLKDDPKTNRLPVIVLSGSVGTEVDALAKQHGVIKTVTKPYDCTALVELVKGTLRSQKR